ncbi:hypothetical protein HDU97_001336 [Phlyctochytrium planicorne]|nr:hypothetical protein HDU97_001336 [Phlyctochytrium planicorne]
MTLDKRQRGSKGPFWGFGSNPIHPPRPTVVTTPIQIPFSQTNFPSPQPQPPIKKDVWINGGASPYLLDEALIQTNQYLQAAPSNGNLHASPTSLQNFFNPDVMNQISYENDNSMSDFDEAGTIYSAKRGSCETLDTAQNLDQRALDCNIKEQTPSLVELELELMQYLLFVPGVAQLQHAFDSKNFGCRAIQKALWYLIQYQKEYQDNAPLERHFKPPCEWRDYVTFLESEHSTKTAVLAYVTFSRSLKKVALGWNSATWNECELSMDHVKPRLDNCSYSYFYKFSGAKPATFNDSQTNLHQNTDACGWALIPPRYVQRQQFQINAWFHQTPGTEFPPTKSQLCVFRMRIKVRAYDNETHSVIAVGISGEIHITPDGNGGNDKAINTLHSSADGGPKKDSGHKKRRRHDDNEENHGRNLMFKFSSFGKSSTGGGKVPQNRCALDIGMSRIYLTEANLEFLNGDALQDWKCCEGNVITPDSSTYLLLEATELWKLSGWMQTFHFYFANKLLWLGMMSRAKRWPSLTPFLRMRRRPRTIQGPEEDLYNAIDEDVSTQEMRGVFKNAFRGKKALVEAKGESPANFWGRITRRFGKGSKSLTGAPSSSLPFDGGDALIASGSRAPATALSTNQKENSREGNVVVSSNLKRRGLRPILNSFRNAFYSATSKFKTKRGSNLNLSGDMAIDSPPPITEEHKSSEQRNTSSTLVTPNSSPNTSMSSVQTLKPAEKSPESVHTFTFTARPQARVNTKSHSLASLSSLSSVESTSSVDSNSTLSSISTLQDRTAFAEEVTASRRYMPEPSSSFGSTTATLRNFEGYDAIQPVGPSKRTVAQDDQLERPVLMAAKIMDDNVPMKGPHGQRRYFDLGIKSGRIGFRKRTGAAMAESL